MHALIDFLFGQSDLCQMNPAVLLPILISLIGQGIGMAGSAKANRRVDDFITGRTKDIQSAFDKEYNTNIFDTAMGESVRQSLLNNFTQASKKLAGNSAVGGKTIEDQVGSMNRLKTGYDNALLQLAGQGTQRQDMLTRNKDARLDNMAGVMLQNLASKGQNWANLGANASNAGSSMAYASAMNPNMFKGIFGPSFGGGGIF
jgi:hypothetical protein